MDASYTVRDFSHMKLVDCRHCRAKITLAKVHGRTTWMVLERSELHSSPTFIRHKCRTKQ